ncbi:hypothetical protein M8J76_005974 [Diaphorina citri]|nr:hypothetical protein M8J75_012648 [Diaphorina citri]KAI5719156.1 hypothetical protein M8J76_005974 [Diaphorina citri]
MIMRIADTLPQPSCKLNDESTAQSISDIFMTVNIASYDTAGHFTRTPSEHLVDERDYSFHILISTTTNQIPARSADMRET